MMARRSQGLVAVAVTGLALAFAAPAGAQTTQEGLVNVNVQDLQVLVPVSLAANLCDLNVGVLARQARAGGAECNATADSLASPGVEQGNDNAPVTQTGLVNANIQGVDVLIPVSIAANVCDANVGVLAEQVRGGGADCTATAESIASPGPGPGGGARVF